MTRYVAGGLCAAVVAVLAGAPPVRAGLIANIVRPGQRDGVADLNARLAGRVLDYTDNHRGDRRLYCPSLDEKRDVYVYLPPGYDGATPFPLMIWLHGIAQDEKNFLDLAPVFDRAIRGGLMPPMVIVAPDGTVRGRPALVSTGSFYINSRAGRYEDYIVHDTWEFATGTFRVRPERGAHVLAGASMGGYAAYNLGFKHRDRFGVLVGILPALDIRYADCHGDYLADYDPGCCIYRDRLRPTRVVGRFYGVILVRERWLTGPTVGRRNPDGMAYFASQNPVELLDTLDVRPGEFEMFIGYSKRDEFNLDAQAEHFIDAAARRGISPAVACLPDGRHDSASGMRFLPLLGPWLCHKLAPYVPAGCGPCTDLLTGGGRPGVFRRQPAPPVWVQTDDASSPTRDPGCTTPP